MFVKVNSAGMSTMMLSECLCEVQQSHSLREKTLPELAAVEAEGPVTHGRGPCHTCQMAEGGKVHGQGGRHP